MFAFLAGTGQVPQEWLKAGGLALLGRALAAVYWATRRRRPPVLIAVMLIAMVFWMLYPSSYALCSGWGLVFATITLGAAWRPADES